MKFKWIKLSKPALLFVLIIIIVVFFCISFRFQEKKQLMNDEAFCFSMESTALPSISTEKPSKNKNIFFIESSCESGNAGKIVISSRQACAVESAAQLNANYTVYLLYVAPAAVKFENTESDLFLEAIMSYKNVKILHINLQDYFKNTPLEDLYKKQKIQKSKFVVSHTSDVLRY